MIVRKKQINWLPSKNTHFLSIYDHTNNNQLTNTLCKSNKHLSNLSIYWLFIVYYFIGFDVCFKLQIKINYHLVHTLFSPIRIISIIIINYLFFKYFFIKIDVMWVLYHDKISHLECHIVTKPLKKSQRSLALGFFLLPFSLL